MEPQEVFYCKEKKEKCNNNKCFGIVTIILAIALAFVVGLLVGAAAIGSEILASFAAIIVLAVILALLLILSNSKYIFLFHSKHHPYKLFFQKRKEK